MIPDDATLTKDGLSPAAPNGRVLLLACGALPIYFGHDGWQQYAPGLKTLADATEIRRRVLSAFELAERTDDTDAQRKYLTFVVVGGGPTGVELAGAIGEMSRYTLARDFRNIDSKLSRIILVEAGPRILPMFPEDLAGRATRDLEKLGWVGQIVARVKIETNAIYGIVRSAVRFDLPHRLVSSQSGRLVSLGAGVPNCQGAAEILFHHFG